MDNVNYNIFKNICDLEIKRLVNLKEKSVSIGNTCIQPFAHNLH
jgi:hypothetical protein